jgi:cystathionine gamma-synthase
MGGSRVMLSRATVLACGGVRNLMLGIPEGLVRYSTGIEDIEDLIDDLAGALAAI